MAGGRWFSQSRRDGIEAESMSSRASSVRDMQRDEEQTLSDQSDDDDGSSVSTSAAKFKQFFRKRSEDLFIELDEPHKVHSPGDSIRGRVILILKNDTRTLYTKLHFHGQIRLGSGKQVVKSSLFRQHLNLWGTKIPSARQQSSNNAKTTTDSHEYDLQSNSQAENANTISGEADYTDQSNNFWKAETLCAGRHVFEFEFFFPAYSLPSSVDFGRGSVSYFLRCDHQKPSNITSRGRSSFRKDLAVLDSIDIGRLPPPKKRLIEPDLKSKRKEGAGRVHACVELARAGYLKGDTITINVALQHVKPIKNMSGTIATLYRLSRFDAKDVAPQSFRKDLSQVVLPILVDPVSLDYRVSPRLRVPPDVFPTVRSAGPVSFRYFVEVVLDLNGRTTVWQAGSSLHAVDAHAEPTFESSAHTVDTDAIKREKGTHCVVFEVVIGTKRSTISPSRIPEDPPLSQVYTRYTTNTSSDSAPLRPSDDFTTRRTSTSDTYGQEYRTTSNELHSQTNYPLSKAALQAMEAALVPSAPPEDLEDAADPMMQATCPPDTAIGQEEQQYHHETPYLRASAPPMDQSLAQAIPRHHSVSNGGDAVSSFATPSAPPLHLFEQLENGVLPAYVHRSSQRMNDGSSQRSPPSSPAAT